MSRFNTSAVKRVQKTPNTTNKAGAPAFTQSNKMKLASILLTSFVQDQYYRSSGGTMTELKELMGKVDPQFAAKAAIFARDEFHMRSITHVVGGEIPARVKGEKWTKRFIDKVIQRPDDAIEILSYYLGTYGKPVPNSLKKGIALGLTKFDEYQLAKYRAEGKGVSLVDVVNLVHVKPTAKNREAFAKLVDGELKSKGTFESELSKAGQADNKEEAKTQAWSDLVRERKIGYFALLRNLRNIEQDAPEVLSDALQMLVDEKLIRKSKVLPFRFATAAQEVTEAKTIKALNKALDIACANVPKLPGKTLIAVDHSGSMGGTGWGANNPKDPRNIGNLFAAVIAKALDADVMVFGDDAKYVKLNTDDSTLTLVDQIDAANYGHGTNFPSVFAKAKKGYDRIITLSDMQSWGTSYGRPQAARDAYEKKSGKVHFYNFDLQGYGTTLFPTERVYEIAGFSEKVFDIMGVLEQDKNALVNRIEAVVI